MTYVAPLKALGRDSLALAGGKGSNLGELVNAGFNVPDGFVITTDAYRERDGDPAGVGDEIARAYAALGGGPVAVRSSATAEDLPGAAFAGQQDTFLNVIGEAAVLEAVRKCWDSLWTERAVSYRERLGIEPDDVAMAVVVQCMVDTDTAGVLFTANPVTGDRAELVMDASSGLGEAVVSGLVTPDHYVLDSEGAVREWVPGRREVVIRGVADGGVREEAGTEPAERLPDAVLRTLAQQGGAIARHFGMPMDIEWAVVDGDVRLLQARPMTALPPPPLHLNAVARKFAAFVLDYVPERPYPIDMSTWVPYGPVGMMHEVTARFGVRSPLGDLFHETDGVVDRLLPVAPRPTIRALGIPYKFLIRSRRFDPAHWMEDPVFTAYLERVRAAADWNLTAMPWPELIQVPRPVMRLVAPITELRARYLPGMALGYLRLLVALKWLGVVELFTDLLAGAQTTTTAAKHGLEALADRVRNDPDLARAVATRDPAALNEFAEFRTAFEDFLGEYGHKETSSPILVTPPSWSDDPGMVLGMIGMLATAPSDREALSDRDEALDRLLAHPRLRNPRRRARMLRRVQAARAGAAFREDSHFYFTMPQPILRRALLEIGRRLTDRQVLGEPEDVFHLRLGELEGYDESAGEQADGRDGRWSGEALRTAVRARKLKRAELAGVPLVDRASVFPREASAVEGALVAGTPVGGGTATGPVRVIREPSEFGRLRPGDVLVCPYTNPSWTPLFQRAVAVVVDVGGTLSHAAIVAREYGIPAVMATNDGTSVLADGRLVTVDGRMGTVVAAPADGMEGTSA